MKLNEHLSVSLLRPISALVIGFTLATSIGCTDKYQESFQAGYAQGSADAEARIRKEHALQTANIQRQIIGESSYSHVSSTSSCGGNGITLNGKHYTGGKTGCVKVYSDGRVEKY